MRANSTSSAPAACVTVVGAGGNIGSHVVPHLGRMPGVSCVVLIDRDVYEPANLTSQDITPREVGRPKALVQARRLRAINPALTVTAIHDDVENVPLGLLRGSVILAGLDSREARRWVNQAAWRLGVPWIDAGVDAGSLLARVNVYVPGQDAPCIECAWDQRDYDGLEQEYACIGGAADPPATGAPSSLGALAAALQAIECRKLLAGPKECAAIGRQVLLDALHHKFYLTEFRRNPACRFDHAVWDIEPERRRPGRTTIAQACGSSSMWVEGHAFVGRLSCPACAAERPLLRLRRRLTAEQQTCPHCGTPMVAAGTDMIERLEPACLGPSMRRRSLSSLGLRAGDVFTVGGASGERHFEIAPDQHEERDERWTPC